MLHITNGDEAAAKLRESGVPGEFLAWRDPLHDGPVPDCDSLPELSDVRARALADFGWGKYKEIRRSFGVRDTMLEGFRAHEEVVLWFGHDLYDQLQKLQVLGWLAGEGKFETKLSLIQISEHPEVTPFHGLGQLNGQQLGELFPQRVEVVREQMDEAAANWAIFTSSSHELLTGLERLLEEYPDVKDGLSRTERQLLWAAEAGARNSDELYAESQKFEEVPWGDSSVWLRLEDLTDGPAPALELVADDDFLLTDVGRAVLAGEADWIQARGGAERWIGGVHLTGLSPRWRWCSETCRLMRQSR